VTADPLDLEEPWRLQAACLGGDHLLFVGAPSVRGSPNPERRQADAEAAAICRRCPVMWDCMEYAVRIRCEAGVWGGLANHKARVNALRERRRGRR
jgi:WhiB family transcriptional regulator, redox-sensing transcriptional regulator